jgi:hypothetical protein
MIAIFSVIAPYLFLMLVAVIVFELISMPEKKKRRQTSVRRTPVRRQPYHQAPRRPRKRLPQRR